MPVDDFPDRAARLAAAGTLPPAATPGDAPVDQAPPADGAQPAALPHALRRHGALGPHGQELTEHVPIRLDPELQRRLEARAALDGTSASDVVRRALRQYLDGS
jgi:ribbon-helix-helix CopG family protein